MIEDNDEAEHFRLGINFPIPSAFPYAFPSSFPSAFPSGVTIPVT